MSLSHKCKSNTSTGRRSRFVSNALNKANRVSFANSKVVTKNPCSSAVHSSGLVADKHSEDQKVGNKRSQRKHFRRVWKKHSTLNKKLTSLHPGKPFPVSLTGRSFFSPTDEQVAVDDSTTYNVNSLMVADGFDGQRIVDDGGFTLIKVPRTEALHILARMVGNMTELCKSFESLCRLEKSIARGGKKCIVSSLGGNPECVRLGKGVCMNQTGLFDAMPKKLDQEQKSCLLRFMKSNNVTLQNFAGPEMNYAMKTIGQFFNWDKNYTDKNGNNMNLLPSMVVGKSVFLELHTDEDAYLGTVSVHCLDDVGEDGKHRKDSDVVVYFVFPSKGTAIPLRSGDTLIFNPLLPHCVSAPAEKHRGSNCCCTSCYLKTSVASLHDNSKQF